MEWLSVELSVRDRLDTDTYVEMVASFAIKDNELVAVTIDRIDHCQIEVGWKMLIEECLKSHQLCGQSQSVPAP